MFEVGIAEAKKAAKSDKLTRAQQADLQEVLDYLGTAGDGNGVKISFGSLGNDATGQLIGNNSIQIDMARIIENSKTDESFHLNYSLNAEIGGVGIHEGRHGINGDYRKYKKDQLSLALSESRLTETKAYTSQSFVFKGLGVNSSIAPFRNMETTGYSAVDIDTVRQSGIRNSVDLNLIILEKKLRGEDWK